jgi:hypothetical protein
MERHLPGIRVLAGKGREAAGCHRTVAFRVATEGIAGTGRDRPARILADGDEQHMAPVVESGGAREVLHEQRLRRVVGRVRVDEAVAGEDASRVDVYHERLSPYRFRRHRRKTLTRATFVL